MCDHPECSERAVVRFTIEDIGFPLHRKRSVDACHPHSAMFKYAGDLEDPDFVEVKAA